MDEKKEELNRIAKNIVASADEDQLIAITAWAHEMIRIRSIDVPKLQKVKLAVAATTDKNALGPLIRIAWLELKRVGWTERGLPARMAIGAAAASLTLTGQGAGIAALGGAIGVPLFVVFGAGGALAGVIIEEAVKKRGG